MKIKYLPLVFVLALASLFLLRNTVIAAPEDKVTICHATGSQSNPWTRIVTSENAIDAHFENPGTPKEGHEDDVLLQGDVPCPGEEPSPTPTNDPSPTNTITPTPTLTVTPTVTPTPTPSITVTPTPTVKLSKTPTPTKTPKPTKTPTPTKAPKPGQGGNVCNIANLISVNQSTGGNKANSNTGGTVNVTSGDANAVLNVNNACGSNYAVIPSSGFNTNVNISDNGAGSLNSVLVNNKSTTSISQ